MSDGLIQVPTDSTGKKVDTSELTVGANTVERQRIVVADPTTAANLATVSAGGALKVDGSAVTQPVSIAAHVTADQGTAAAAAGSWPVEVTDGTNVLATSTHPVRTDPTGTTTQPVSGTVTATLSGSINNTGFNVTPATSGGCSIYHAVSAGSNNAASVKGSAGQIFGWSIFNLAGYPVYVKFFAKATSPTPGTDTVVKTIGVQSGTRTEAMFDVGIAIATGIGIAIVKGIADADNTAILASDCVVDIFYK